MNKLIRGKSLLKYADLQSLGVTNSRTVPERFSSFYRSIRKQHSKFSTIPSPLPQQTPGLGNPTTNSSTTSTDSEQKKKSSSNKDNDDDDDFLSKHGGKVAIIALSIAAGLIYTYYLSIQDRNQIEKSIETYEMIIDPYELLDLRNANQIQEEQFINLLKQFLQEEAEGKTASSSNHPELIINSTQRTPSILNSEDSTSSGRDENQKKRVVNIPTISYQHFIQFIGKNRNLFHQNNHFSNQPVKNIILLPYLLDRIIQKQISQDINLNDVSQTNTSIAHPSQYSFSMYQSLNEEEKLQLQEEIANTLKGKILIAEKNKELFRIYPFELLIDQLASLSSSAARDSNSLDEKYLSFANVRIAFDYLFILLTLLMHDRKFPETIQQRLSALFYLATVIQAYQVKDTEEGSSLPTDEIVKEWKENKLSRDMLLRLIYLLQITSQFPPEKQVIETGVKWPVKLHRRKTPFDMVQVYEEQQKKGEIKEWSFQDFESFLISNHNCIWGTCYHEQKQLIYSKPPTDEGKLKIIPKDKN